MAVSHVTPSSQPLAVRPPEYWPRLEYMALLQAVDCFVVADTFQYSRQSFHNRTRVRNPQGWQWLSVPLKGGQHGTSIAEVRIRRHLPWRSKHWHALAYNYRSAPFFDYYEPRLRLVYEQEWSHLGTLTVETVRVLAEMLGLSTTLVRASRHPAHPSDVPDVVDAYASSTVVIPKPIAAIDAPHAEEPWVLQYAHPTYHQNFEGFEEGMSALDLLFNYGPEAAALLAQGVTLESRSGEDETSEPR